MMASPLAAEGPNPARVRQKPAFAILSSLAARER